MTNNIDIFKRIYNLNKSSIYLLPEGCGGILYHTEMFDDNIINYDYRKINIPYFN